MHAAVFGLLSEGLTPERVAILGFSQGAALAAEAALTLGLPAGAHGPSFRNGSSAGSPTWPSWAVALGARLLHTRRADHGGVEPR